MGRLIPYHIPVNRKGLGKQLKAQFGIPERLYSEVLNDERRDAIARRAMVNTVSPQLKVVPPESEVIDVDSETPTPFVSSDENASESSGDSKKK